MSDFFQLRDRYKAQSPRNKKTEPIIDIVADPITAIDDAFVLTGTNGKTYITARASVTPRTATQDKWFTQLSGKYVGAGVPNRNKDLMTLGDVEFGLPTVAGSPVNLLHISSMVLGAVTEARMIHDAAIGSHLEIDASLWNWINGSKVAMVHKASADGQLFLSMEAIPEQVQCGNCAAVFAFEDDAVCAHLLDHTAVRRLINPTFVGAGIILGGAEPAWPDATASVVSACTAEVEHATLGLTRTMSQKDAESLVKQILVWSSAAS